MCEFFVKSQNLIVILYKIRGEISFKSNQIVINKLFVNTTKRTKNGGLNVVAMEKKICYNIRKTFIKAITEI